MAETTTTRKPGRKDHPVSVRLSDEMLERLRFESARRDVPVATTLRMLAKERLDELERESDAWAYTPEAIASARRAEEDARAGRVVDVSGAELGRIADLPDDEMAAEIQRLYEVSASGGRGA